MWFLVVAMLVILVLAGLVVLYVAFPHRGEDVPYFAWLGRLLRKGVDTAPTLDNTADRSAAARGLVAPRPDQPGYDQARRRAPRRTSPRRLTRQCRRRALPSLGRGSGGSEPPVVG